jgi:hypothetical protein
MKCCGYAFFFFLDATHKYYHVCVCVCVCVWLCVCVCLAIDFIQVLRLRASAKPSRFYDEIKFYRIFLRGFYQDYCGFG